MSGQVVRFQRGRSGKRTTVGAWKKLFPSPNYSERRQRPLVWMYAIGLKNGDIKFGITAQPRIRIGGHLTAFGDQFAWAHLFGSMREEDGRAGENHTLGLAAAYGRQIGRREIFSGLTKDVAIFCGREGVSFVNRAEQPPGGGALLKAHTR